MAFLRNAAAQESEIVITKEHILAEIRRTATANGGVPLGRVRFCHETGIKPADWHGKFWARWSDALNEAGFQPNELNAARSNDDLLSHLASFVRELGKFPAWADIKLKAHSDPSFPSPNTFGRFGRTARLAAELERFCLEQGEPDVAKLCAVAAKHVNQDDPGPEIENISSSDLGYVYLLKSGRFYKIGRTNAVGRRERELAIQLPEPAKVIHKIKTDDPVGIEQYWHNRFHERRRNGEWFELAVQDLAAFKRRKFM